MRCSRQSAGLCSCLILSSLDWNHLLTQLKPRFTTLKSFRKPVTKEISNTVLIRKWSEESLLVLFLCKQGKWQGLVNRKEGFLLKFTEKKYRITLIYYRSICIKSCDAKITLALFNCILLNRVDKMA